MVVAPLEGRDADELFRLTLLRGGLLHMKATDGVRFGGKPVPEKGMTLPSSETLCVQLGEREWSITPTTKVNEQHATDELFARIHPNPAHSVEGERRGYIKS